jgi:hypothetical protein
MGKNFLKTNLTADNLKDGADGINGISLCDVAPALNLLFSPLR